MRMNSVPRSIAENLGTEFKREAAESGQVSKPSYAAEYVSSLDSNEWERHRPDGAAMSGEDYKRIWKRLSGFTSEEQ